jgi:tRNA G10  N-methylase Trm11
VASINNLKHDHKNARKRTDQSAELIKESLQRYGAARSIVIDENDRILAGNGTVEGAKAAGIQNVRVIETDGDEIIAIRRTGLSEDEKVGLALADNRASDLSAWDKEMLHRLSAEHDLSPWFAEEDLSGLAEPETFADFDEALEEASSEPQEQAAPNKLSDRFGIAPFTILNAREGWWQERKRQWIALGIQSEVGRKGNLLGMSETILQPDEQLRQLKETLRDSSAQTANIEVKIPGYYQKKNAGMSDEQIVAEFLESGSQVGAGTSIFDPVLAELSYRWFSPENGIILDPFAGGSVRGIVAAKTNRQYIGCDLRQEQIDANREQAATIAPDTQPIWHCTDSRNIDRVCKGVQADMIFSCPPYADLEVYSDDPNDLSTLPYDLFLDSYREIIAKTCSLLKDNAFACFVVGDVRDKKGNYYNFVGDTIQAFLDAGLSYYNEAILVTPVGTLPLRAGRTFAATRKLGKTHQNVLVFLKGDARKAVASCGDCDFADIQEEPQPQAPAATTTEYGEKLTAASLGGEL